REAFRKLSRWFGEEATPMYYWYGAPPRITDVISRGGFGGAVAPSAPGMGFEQRSASPQSTDTIAFLNLPRLTLPKGGVARIEIAQQKLSVEHAYLWIHDLSERERNAYTSWSAQRDRQRFTTLEELAYSVAQERLFRNEVYEAVILRNTGSTPWTTAPVTILRDNMPVGQDILLFTPPGEEAFVFITPAPRLGVVCTVEADTSQQASLGLGYTSQSPQRVTVRVQNLNEQPVRLVARVRFVGHYKDATREPKRILAKTATDPGFWHWYYGNRLQQNPYTELVWDVEAPPGVSEWQFRYERKALY
ncbi:MAG: hypothetical protein NZ556_05010, partial [Fimbriimonadales bacterium]|nr:hypothetical protein [Fimbriimonadales bacterium]